MRCGRRLLLGIVLWAGSGCFTWSEVRSTGVEPGARVRARLTATEMERVGEATGREARVVEGDVLQSDGGHALVVALPVRAEPGSRQSSLRTSVTLSPPGIEALEVRSLDVFRTALVAGVAAVASGVIVDELFTGRGSSDDEIPDPEASIRIPILRFFVH